MLNPDFTTDNLKLRTFPANYSVSQIFAIENSEMKSPRQK